MKNWFFAAVLSIAVVVPFFYWLFVKPDNVAYSDSQAAAVIEFEPKNPIITLEPGMELRVKSARILDGYIYDLCLENNQWIRTQLPVATKEEATSFVVETLRGEAPVYPMVVLRRKVGDYWVVDFFATLSGKKVNLRELLKEKDLGL